MHEEIKQKINNLIDVSAEIKAIFLNLYKETIHIDDVINDIDKFNKYIKDYLHKIRMQPSTLISNVAAWDLMAYNYIMMAVASEPKNDKIREAFTKIRDDIRTEHYVLKYAEMVFIDMKYTIEDESSYLVHKYQDILLAIENFNDKWAGSTPITDTSIIGNALHSELMAHTVNLEFDNIVDIFNE